MLLKRKFILILAMAVLMAGSGLNTALANDGLAPITPIEPIPQVQSVTQDGVLISAKNSMLIDLVNSTTASDWVEGLFENVTIAYDAEEEAYISLEKEIKFLMADPKSGLPFKKIVIKRGSNNVKYEYFNRQVENGGIESVARIIFWHNAALRLNIASRIDY